MSDMFLVKIKLLSTGVRRDSLKDFPLLINSDVQLFWYIAPRARKFDEKSCHVLTALLPLCLLNDPTLHGHKAKSVERNVLLSLIQGITVILEKSYTNRKSLSDYLEYNISLVRAAQADSYEPYYGVIPLPNAEMFETFRKKDQNWISELTDRISSRGFYDPISFDTLSPMRRNDNGVAGKKIGGGGGGEVGAEVRVAY